MAGAADRRLLLLFALLAGAEAAVATARDASCPRDDRLLSRFFLRHPDSCSASAPPLVGVVEGNERTLHDALHLIYKNNGEYVVVLFYASWCPFSKICRLNFDTVSSLFPAIRHFAFEESVIRPSILSRYGVHGFPTLFLINSTIKVRYLGSRKVNSFITFYSNITGIKPIARDKVSLEKSMTSFNEIEQTTNMDSENCPFPWARSPERLLEQDKYLALATVFVLLRLSHILVPKLLACVNRAWRRHIRYASLINLIQVFMEQAKHAISRLNPYCKQQNLQEEALIAGRAWASKSLASVSIAESCSGRIHTVHEER